MKVLYLAALSLTAIGPTEAILLRFIKETSSHFNDEDGYGWYIEPPMNSQDGGSLSVAKHSAVDIQASSRLMNWLEWTPIKVSEGHNDADGNVFVHTSSLKEGLPAGVAIQLPEPGYTKTHSDFVYKRAEGRTDILEPFHKLSLATTITPQTLVRAGSNPYNMGYNTFGSPDIMRKIWEPYIYLCHTNSQGSVLRLLMRTRKEYHPPPEYDDYDLGDNIPTTLDADVAWDNYNTWIDSIDHCDKGYIVVEDSPSDARPDDSAPNVAAPLEAEIARNQHPTDNIRADVELDEQGLPTVDGDELLVPELLSPQEMSEQKLAMQQLRMDLGVDPNKPVFRILRQPKTKRKLVDLTYHRPQPNPNSLRKPFTIRRYPPRIQEPSVEDTNDAFSSSNLGKRHIFKPSPHLAPFEDAQVKKTKTRRPQEISSTGDGTTPKNLRMIKSDYWSSLDANQAEDAGTRRSRKHGDDK